MVSTGELTQPAQGWWQASDGLWYPPETTPDWEATGPTGRARSGKATAALVLGVLGVVGPVFSITAIIFGVLARRDIAASHEEMTGRSYAVAGLTLGIIFTTISAAVAVWMFSSGTGLDDLLQQAPTFPAP